MKKLFISQPMRNRTDEEILTERGNIVKEIKEKFHNEDIEIIDSFISTYPSAPSTDTKTIPLWYLGKSLMLLADADIIYFAKGWEKNRGCRIEHTCAVEYGIDNIIYG